MTEETIFLAALTKTSPSERATFLDEACAGNLDLRASVEQLIRAHEHAGSFLEVPVLGSGRRAARGATKSDPTVPAAPTSPNAPPGERSPASAASPASLASHEWWDGTGDLCSFLNASDQSGSVPFLGPYAVSELIGRGGMGVVLKGHDPKLNRVVAIKILAPELALNTTARKRFLREAQAAAAVSHNHVVTTHAIDEVGNYPYIVMEYVAGRSLQDRIDRDGPLDVKRILRIARQTALGLAAAHEQGLIHRDVKPANILLENGIERVKLSDFGLARAIDDVSMTQPGTVAGTPQYMSPEQARGERGDHRSDLFSLGCVMYAMCTGRSPFRAATTVAALRRVCDDKPRPIDQINSEIPAWLIAIIDRLLEKRPDDRFESASEIADVLGRCLTHVEHPTKESQVELTKVTQRPVPQAEQVELTAPACPATIGRRAPRQQGAQGWFASPGRRMLTVASILALACAAVGIAEATGFSELHELLVSVLRIGTPHGTLIVEVGDPAVEVTVAGEDVVITGAGPNEVRLKPGMYHLHARKQGKLVAQELVTISHQGRQVVRIGFEPAPDRMQKSAVPGEGEPAFAYQFAERAQLAGQPGVPYAACFLPRPDTIVSWSVAAGGARILHVPDGVELRRIAGAFGALAVVPDGQRIVTGSHREENDGNQLVVWDVGTGREQWASPEVSGVFHDVAVSSDGTLAVSGHGQWWGDHQRRDHRIRVWDLEQRKLLREISGHADQVMAVAIAPDGKRLLSGGRDRTVRLWDLDTGDEIRRFEGLGTEVFDVAFSPDGRLVLAGYGPDEQSGLAGPIIDDPEHCVAVMWNRETGTEVQRFVGHHGCIRSVGFSPDGRVVVTGSGEAYVGAPLPDGSSKKTRDNSVRLWDAQTGEQLGFIPHRTSVQSASFSSDGADLLSGEWQVVHLWQVPEGLRRSAADESKASARKFPLLISSNRGGNFDIYRLDDWQTSPAEKEEEADESESRWTKLTNHPAEDTGPAWSSDGERIAFCSSRSGNLDIWTMNHDGSDLVQVTDFPGIDRTPCWSPDGERIAFVRHLTRDNWEIFVINADGSNPVNLTNHPAKESDPAWSPDGTTIAYSFDGDGTHVYLMNADGSEPRLLSGRKGSFMYPAWSPDGSQLVFTGWAGDVGGDLELFVINADGSDERQLSHLQGLNTYAAWSPDGQSIAFEHRRPNTARQKPAVYVMGADGAEPRRITGAEAHIGYGGGRPAWGPQPTQAGEGER